MLSFVSNRVGILLSVNDPMQQLVSKKGGGLIFEGGRIIARLWYSYESQLFCILCTCTRFIVTF